MPVLLTHEHEFETSQGITIGGVRAGSEVPARRDAHRAGGLQEGGPARRRGVTSPIPSGFERVTKKEIGARKRGAGSLLFFPKTCSIGVAVALGPVILRAEGSRLNGAGHTGQNGKRDKSRQNGLHHHLHRLRAWVARGTEIGDSGRTGRCAHRAVTNSDQPKAWNEFGRTQRPLACPATLRNSPWQMTCQHFSLVPYGPAARPLAAVLAAVRRRNWKLGRARPPAAIFALRARRCRSGGFPGRQHARSRRRWPWRSAHRLRAARCVKEVAGRVGEGRTH
jgi:hypothetical protein